MSVGQEIGYAIGAAGVVLAYVTHRIEGRRARPVVVCHEDQKRDLHGVALVHLTNESAASAFNIRFGITMEGVHIGWKHSESDPDLSRLNVLRPGDREPPPSESHRIVIPEEVAIWSRTDRDPDEGRSYWAYYQSPGGDWWYTSNPVDRSADLMVKRIRSGRFGPLSGHRRKLDRRLREGAKVRSAMLRELREGMTPDPPARNDAADREES
jgi:hypothetical protein